MKSTAPPTLIFYFCSIDDVVCRIAAFFMPEISPLFQFCPHDILFEDDVIVVVNKPSGLASQATLDPNRDHCYAAVKRYLARNGGTYAGLHHRLDGMTSGAMIFTKTPQVNGSISAQFQQHTICKTYCAICAPTREVDLARVTPGQTWIETAPIGALLGGRVQKFGIDGKKRKPAQTEFCCEKSVQMRDGFLVVYACSPRTGRTHQIRVHLSARGLPIVGDTLYGTPLLRSLRSIAPNRLCLHAIKIAFDHPVTGERIEVTAPLPAELDRFVRNAQKMGRPWT